MDPISLAVISTAATAGAAGISAYGAMKSGQSQSGQLKYQAGIAQVNQQIARQNADYVRAAGDVEATKSGMAGRFRMGKIITGQAARGIDIASGSPEAVRSSQQKIIQMDQNTIRQNAAQRAWGYEVEAVKATEEGRMLRRGAENVEKAAKINAIGSILGGVSSVSSKWMQASQLGIGSGSVGGDDPWGAYEGSDYAGARS